MRKIEKTTGRSCPAPLDGDKMNWENKTFKQTFKELSGLLYVGLYLKEEEKIYSQFKVI